MLRKLFFVAFFVSFCSLSPVVSASQLINVDFNGADANNTPPGPGPTATGAAVIGKAGDIWNGVDGNSGSAIPLVANGVATSATLSFSSTGSWNAQSSPAPNPALMQDYLYQNGPGGSADLSGLIHGGTYNLYLYTQNNDSNTRQTDFTVNGNTLSSGVGSQNLAAWVNTVNYTEFVGVKASSLGNLNISFAGHGGEGEFNGLQLFSTIPEPGSFVLAGLGAIGLLFAARRRRKA